MRIGVIGGAGFIVSHVVDKLVEAGHDVTVFGIMQPHRLDVRHVVADIPDASRTTVALAGRYDVLYLFAAVSDVNDVFLWRRHDDPARRDSVWPTACLGTVRLAEILWTAAGFAALSLLSPRSTSRQGRRPPEKLAPASSRENCDVRD